MKALSLWQPWASAMAVGAKRIETRSWPAVASGHAFRGWVAIHASKRTHWPKDAPAAVSGMSLENTFEYHLRISLESYQLFVGNGFGVFSSLPMGAVVAVGWMNYCESTTDLKVSELEAMWGGYEAGRYGWVFSEMWRLNDPMPARGKQKLFDLDMPANWQAASTRVF